MQWVRWQTYLDVEPGVVLPKGGCCGWLHCVGSLFDQLKQDRQPNLHSNKMQEQSITAILGFVGFVEQTPTLDDKQLAVNAH